MEEIKDMLEEREKYFHQLKEEKERVIKGAPEGYLRVCQSRNKIQYYKRTNPKDFSGTYINESNMKIAYELAQKDYNQKILKSIEKELKAISKYKEAYPDKTAEQIYESLHPARQKLIIPIRETDEELITRWEKVEYTGKEFYDDSSEHYTAKGERVRSKSEVIIADALHRAGIPYRYEYHPEYAETFVHKINCYEKNGYHLGDTLICTFETRKNPLNHKTIKEIIQRNF